MGWLITMCDYNKYSEVANLGKPKTYPVNGELCGRLSKIIEDYEGRVSTAEVIGLLEMLKISIYNEAVKEDLNNECN